ncbi:hypothetical protein ABIE32_002490 [Comamonas sp. 4034]
MFSDAAIQFHLTLKRMFGMSLRQATGPSESLIKLARLDWRMPDYRAPCRSTTGLHLLIGSTGVKMLGEDT